MTKRKIIIIGKETWIRRFNQRRGGGEIERGGVGCVIERECMKWLLRMI